MKVLPDDNLGLYFDREAREPVTSLNFRVLNLKPPLLKSRETAPIDVYIRDESGLGLRLVEPCRDVVSNGQRIGHVEADIFDMEGRRRGHTCDQPPVRMAPGEMVRARVRIRDLDPGLEPRDRQFPVVFGAFAFSGTFPPGSTFAAWADVQPTIDGVHAAGEWDDAECHTNTVSSSNLTICVKNDLVNLYVGVEVTNQTYSDPNQPGFDFLNLLFDNDNDGTIETGDDRLNLRYDSAVVHDSFNPNGVPHHSSTDTSDGGADDLVAAVVHSNPVSNGLGTYTAEYQHPLDTTDDAHDFSLAIGDTVGFAFSMAEGDDPPDYGFYFPSTVPAISPGWAEITITDCATTGDTTVGQDIVFSSLRNPTFTEIYTMTSTGANQTRLTNNNASDDDPVWSPDGTMIAFSTNRDGNFEIYVIDADGSNPTNLTLNSGNDYEPSWSPDGNWIAFHTDRDGDFEVYKIPSAGGVATNISNLSTANDSSPDWSPTGDDIAFDTSRDGNVEIYRMTSTGGNPTRLTNDPAFDFNPAWSPAGGQIAFNSDRGGDVEIYVMDDQDLNADGEGDNMVLITNSNPGTSEWPAWSPDASQFALAANTTGTYEIYTMPSAGGPPTNISNHPASDLMPDWNPSPGP